MPAIHVRESLEGASPPSPALGQGSEGGTESLCREGCQDNNLLGQTAPNGGEDSNWDDHAKIDSEPSPQDQLEDHWLVAGPPV